MAGINYFRGERREGRDLVGVGGRRIKPLPTNNVIARAYAWPRQSDYVLSMIKLRWSPC